MPPKQFTFKATIWLYPGGGAAWHFATLPVDAADEINFFYSEHKRGWGSLPVEATIGATTWKTSIFPQKERSSYILPIKASVRKSESLAAGDEAKFILQIMPR